MTREAGPSAGPAPLIETDERWEGELRPAGSIAIAEGATLTLARGARLFLSAGARIQVRGRLVVDGAPESLVTLETAGISVLGEGAVELRHAVVSRLEGDGLSLYDRARGECVDSSFAGSGRFVLNHRSEAAFRVERCAVSGSRIGLSAFGGPLMAVDCRFEDQAELALELSCKARLERVSARGAPLALKIVGGRTEAAALSLSARDGAKVIGASSFEWAGGSCAIDAVGIAVEGGEAKVRGVRFEGGERGSSVEKGRLVADDCVWHGQRLAGVTVGEDGSVELSGCGFSGAPTGIGARGPAALSRCRFSGHAGQALDLHGAGHRVRDSAVSECGVGAALSGRAELERVDIEGRRHALILARGARLEWTGGLATSAGTALVLEQAEASLKDLRVTGGQIGLAARGGRLSASACAFEKHAAAAVELDGGEHELSAVSAAECGTGLVVAAGSCRGEGLSLSGRDACALVRRDGRLSLAKSRLLGAKTGAFVEGGGFEARGCAFEDQDGCAVLGAGGAIMLSECSVSGARKGLSARGGDVALADCALSGQREVSLELFCAARLERVSASSGALALRVAGGETEASALALSGRDGVEVSGEARFSWNGGSCEAKGVGLAVSGTATKLVGVELRGGATGIRLAAGTLVAADCRWRVEGAGLSVEGGTAELRECEFRGGRIGARLRAGSLTALDCSFEDQGELSLELSRAARLERLSARCRALALKIVGGETEALDVDVAGGDGVKLVGSSRLRWRGGSCAAERVGLGVEGGEAEVHGVRFLGGERGASVETGLLAADGAVWEGQKLAGVAVGPRGRARLDACSFSGAPTGASARGPILLNACRFQGHDAQGVDLHGEGHELQGCELSECGVGAALGGTARFSRVTARGMRHAVALAPTGRLEWREGAAAADGIAFFSGGGSALLEDLRCEGGEGGALIEGGRLSAARCAFEGGGAALELSGGAHELSKVSATNGETGLVVSDGACRASGLELAGRAAGLLVREGGTLDWSGGRCEGRRALELSGGTARLDGVSCAGDAQAARLEGGALTGRRMSLRGGADCGVLVDKGAFCELGESELAGAPVGLAVRDGHAHLLEGLRFSGCARAVAVDPAASLCLKSRESPRVGERPLLGFVLETKDRFPWRSLYWLAYAAGAAWLRARLACARGIEAARLHRGWITGDWQPGVSDLDALAVARDLKGAAGGARLRELWASYARWKKRLPFLGEILIAERADFEAFVNAGGNRAQAVARALRLPAPKTGAVAGDLIECAHAYTRLLQCAFSPGEPWARNARQAAKAFLDALRYGPLAEAGRPALSRREAADELRRRGWTARVRTLEALSEAEPGEPELVLSRAAAETLSALDEWLDAQGSRHEAGANHDFHTGRSEPLDELRACFGGEMVGALSDELYRSYVVLDERGAHPEELAHSLAAAARRRTLLPGTLPVPLTRRAWRALARSSYMEDPTRELGGPRLAAGRLFPGVAQSAWGECLVPIASSPADERSAARSAAANLALTWRWLGAAGSGSDPRVVFHYLVGRTLGLRLMLERQIVLPFFDLDGLIERSAREFPELAAPLRELAPLPKNATLDEAFLAIYPLIDGQVRRLVELLRSGA